MGAAQEKKVGSKQNVQNSASETQDTQTQARPKGPAQTEPTPVADQWKLEKIYNDPAAILIPPPKLKDIFADCVFMFDTSALLTPYESDKATLAEIRRVLKPLANAKRLFVPQRALREFANNRGAKITETANKLLALRQETIDVAPVPFLGNLRTVGPLIEARSKLLQQIADYHRVLDGLIEDIRSINYDDPISELYRELFPAGAIIKSQKSREELEKDFARRVEFNIPPGYEDKHIGDLVIWHTILEHGASTQRNTVFVSNDIKEDWAHKIGEKEFGQMVAARYELVYEYSQTTSGKHYAQIQLAELLKYLKASDEAIRTVEASQRAALVGKELDHRLLLRRLQMKYVAPKRKASVIAAVDSHLAAAMSLLTQRPVDFEGMRSQLAASKTRARNDPWLSTTIVYNLIYKSFRQVRDWDRQKKAGTLTEVEANARADKLFKTLDEVTRAISLL
jgi:hypothetical protein